MRLDVAAVFARELGTACDVSGLTDRELARRAGISQPQISRFRRGLAAPDLAEAERVIAATGHRLVLKVVPGDGVRLRDSGQLALAELIRCEHRRELPPELARRVGGDPLR